MKIPFDSICLDAIVDELKPYVGGKIQGVRGPSEDNVALELYANGAEGCLLLSCQPMFARAHFITRRPANPAQPLRFCAAVRSRLMGARILQIRQVAADRILEIRVENEEGEHRLIGEFMGKHSNLFLVDASSTVVSAAKWVTSRQSRRSIQPGAPYEWPPVVDLSNRLLSSPFFKHLVAASNSELDRGAVLVAGHGAYPFRLNAVGLTGSPKPTLSTALEAYFDRAILEEQTESLRGNLLAQVDRVRLAREVAIGDLERLQVAGDRATELQKVAELILAYGAHLPVGTAELGVWDYEGQAQTLKLDPEKTGKENALAMFERAKRAKSRREWVADQLPKMRNDLAALDQFRTQVLESPRLRELEALRDEAKKNRWLHAQLGSGKAKEDRPFEGHRVRQLIGPGNCAVLYGENAESNDYLTARVARSNDWWLHVRGGTSAHVVILTGNQPERISKEQLLFAAKVAVQNSPSKHAGFVAVDYTLKKYVRKPRGAAKGTALYSNEKTLHVEG